MNKFLVLTLLFLNSYLVFAANYQSEVQSFKLEKLLEGQDIIWSFDFIGGFDKASQSENKLVFTKKTGGLAIYDIKQKKLMNLENGPDFVVKGQGGVLDVKISRDFIYVTYACKDKSLYTTCLGRGKIQGTKIVGFKEIFRAKAQGDSGRHFGSRLSFDDQGHIFMTIGDRGERDKAQDLQWHNGKILKLTLEGKPAPGNPFTKGLPEIWSMGHRNPQGIFYDIKTSQLWSCEFGPRGGDEINLVQRGKNYGWPIITYGKEYWGPSIGTTHKAGFEQPITYYVPSISPSGMTFYRGDKLKAWNGNLFLAALGSEFLQRVVIKDNKVIKQERLLESLEERIRMVREGRDGFLYFSTDSGKIFRLMNIKGK